MTSVFKKFFHSFKEKPDIWFFYAFLATSTLSIRKVFLYYPINNNFNEYTGIYLYLSDIFLFLTIMTWLFILCNNNSILSTINRAYQQVIHNYILFFPLFIAIFSFLSILWSSNQQIALFRSVKLFEFVLLFFYLYKLFHVEQFNQNKLVIKKIFQIIIGLGIFQSVIGIIQFFMQSSIGLLWLKESIISPQTQGVAKIILDGEPFVRAYALFQHPNIFGGFLIFSITTSVLYLKLFHVEQFSNFKQYLKICLKNFSSLLIVPRGTIYISIILASQGLALLLTFSKSAIIGLFLGLFYLYTTRYSTPIKMFHVEHYKRQAWKNFDILKISHIYKKLLLIAGIMAMLFIILRSDTYSFLFKSLQERTFYINVSRGTFLSHPLIGIGSGQFVINMQNISVVQPWQYQPVHNVFLLILNELGIVIFFMFLYFIYKLFHSNTNVPRGTLYGSYVEYFPGHGLNVYFKAILISFIFIMLFDHYLWDIQQGQALLWSLFGIIAVNNRK